MRNTFMILALTFILSGVSAATEIRTFGEALTADLELTPIEQIVSDPDTWVDKRVRISGVVTGVCANKGC